MERNFSGTIKVTNFEKSNFNVTNTDYACSIKITEVSGSNTLSYKVRINSNFTRQTLIAYKKYDESVDPSSKSIDDSREYIGFNNNINFVFYINSLNRLQIQATGVKTGNQFVINGILNQV